MFEFSGLPDSAGLRFRVERSLKQGILMVGALFHSDSGGNGEVRRMMLALIRTVLGNGAEGLPDDAMALLREMLSELELEGLERRFPAALSGGQRQRLALGRALIAKPDVLFMDEPFSALDAVLREHLQHFLKQLRERHPCTMVFVTHDIGEAVYLGEYIMLLGARPSRVAAFGANPSFTADAGVDVRGTDAFYAVQRRLHNAVAAVRIGKELHLTDGTW